MSSEVLRSPSTEERPLVHYVVILVVVPLALGVIGWSGWMALIALLVGAGVTPMMLTLYLYVIPRLGEPRSRLGQGLVHLAAIAVGSVVGCLPAVLTWSAMTGHSVDVVYWNVLRITLVVTTLVTLAMLGINRAGQVSIPVADAPRLVEPSLRLTARHHGTVHLVDPQGVTRLYAADKYVAAMVDDREVLLDESLSSLEERLGPLGFVRTHRGELVNRHHVRSFEGSEILLTDGQRARVSRRAAARVRRMLTGS